MSRSPSDSEFTDFASAMWPSLYRTAYLMLGDRQLAEDLVQTALAKTYATWGRVRDLDAAPAYARTTMTNTAASWFRKRSWRNEIPTLETGRDDLEAAHDAPIESSPLSEALAQLPPRQRAVVVLRYFEDYSVTQTADALGIAEGTVKSQTSHALAQLRDVLDPIGEPT